MKTPQTSEHYNPIRSDEGYTVKQFLERTDLGMSSLRHAEAAGLKVVFVGKRKYIRGAAWLEFLNAREQARERRRKNGRDDEENEDEG